MTQNQYMNIIVQDPSLVSRAGHESLGLLLRADIESLVINSLEGALDYYTLLTLCLKYTFVQLDVLHTRSLTIDYFIP